jgi:hypothetical protein
MNALASHEFAIIDAPVTEWLVLRCSSSRTMAWAALLAQFGAWTPTWKVSKQLPRSSMRRKVTEACIPSYVFVPAFVAYDLPTVPKIPYSWMKGAEGMLTRVPDRQLAGLRDIADKPLIPASKLPKAGAIVLMPDGPWQGLRAKVVKCTQRAATVEIETQKDRFTQKVQLPSCLLLKI